MHRSIRDSLEEVLAGSHAGDSSREHLRQCEECRGEVESMLTQARMLREIRAEVEPRAGFYARVMERIENQGAISVWNAFSESAFGRRIAVASMALALLLGAYLATAESRDHSAVISMDNQPVWNQPVAPDREAVLVNLVTYREQ